MGELGGFLRIERSGVPYADPAQRVEGENAYREFLVRRPDIELAEAESAMAGDEAASTSGEGFVTTEAHA